VPAILVSTLLKALLAFAALLVAMPAGAAPEPGPGAGRCFADGARNDTLAGVAAAPGRWTCGPESHSIDSERIFVRFPATYHLFADLVMRLPPGSRLRRLILTRGAGRAASA